jgi:Kef-type K+ transport system membrane component KefB
MSFLSTILGSYLNDVWFQLTFLIVVSIFASFLFARFGQPRIIGYIVVGVIIGPSLLGVIVPPASIPGVPTQPVATGLPESIIMLAQLGAIILLFMIGLECDLKEIYTRRSISIALGGVLVPWGAGYFIAQAFGFSSEAIFIGATLVATSVAITASVISQLGLIGTPVAYAIVGAAVVDDVLGMVVLSISKGLTQTGHFDVVAIGLLVVGAALFVVLGAWIGANILSRLVFSVQVSGFRRRLPMSGFVLALAIAFLYSFVAETIGITALVGAFVAGTAFSGSALRDGLRKGAQYMESLFVPIFFVSLGVAVDLAGIWEQIWFGLALTAVAVVTKIVGCGIPARFAGMSFWDSFSVGIGMMPRLEIALVIAYYGLTTSIINSELYSVIVFMGLVTALFTPSILKLSLSKAGHAFVES